MKSWKPMGRPGVQGTGRSMPDLEEIKVNEILNL